MQINLEPPYLIVKPNLSEEKFYRGSTAGSLCCGLFPLLSRGLNKVPIHK
jgi:hypothetical protein